MVLRSAGARSGRVPDRRPQNRLLSALPALDEGDLSLVTWKERALLYHAGETIGHVYFPLDAVVSIVAEVDGGPVVQVATVGREGMTGVGVLLRTSRADHRTFVQVPGQSLVLSAHRLLELVDQYAELGRMLYRYVQALMAQMARSVPCNRTHSVDERAAQWLLMTHDRVGRDEFPLTQEFLGQMLGVARPRVSTAAAALQRTGCIRYRRGHITVTDRQALEEASCECYRIVAAEYDRLLA